jgi:hypothetical protein
MGFFETESGLWSFNVSSNFSFIPEVHFIPDNLPTLRAIQTQTKPFTVSLQVGFRSRKICVIGFGWLIMVVW